MATKPDLKINIKAEVDANIKRALGEIEAGMEDVSDATKQATASTKAWKDAIADVSRVKAEYSTLRAEAKAAGESVRDAATQQYKQSLLNAKAIRDETKLIRDRTAAQAVGAKVSRDAVNKAKPRGDDGLTEGERLNALRNVPAQFTDIVTSLGSGQSPLTVLLQQGGQLKDQFGGIGNAARQLGAYIASLVGPFTILGTALAVVAVGFYKGRQEATEMTKALALTNNAAGATVDSMVGMAQAIDNVTGTQAKASAVLSLLAGSGMVGAESLQALATAAIRLDSVGGPAAEETAAKFAELGKSPTDAARKLNEQIGFLNVTTYEQIRALENAGRTTEAAKLAQDAYRDSIEKSADKIEQRLGTLEKTAKAITGFFKEMWDAILNVGREDTFEQQIDKVEKRLEDLRRIKASGFNRAGGNDAEIAAAEAELAGLRKSVADAKATAAKDAATVRANKLAVRKSDAAFASTGQVPGARTDADATLLKASLAAANDAYKTAYDTGLINLQGYYDARAAIITAENQAELDQLNEQLRQAKIQLGKASVEGQASAQAAVIAAQSRVDAAGITGQGRLSGNSAERTKATRDYALAIDALNLKLMENAGAENTAAAAALRRSAVEAQYSTQLGQASTEEQRATIRATIEAQVATGNLTAAQLDKERQLQSFVQRRAEIESDLSQGRISAIDAEERLYSLEQQRNDLMLQLLQTMQQIPNLAVDQQNAISMAIQQSQNALRQMDPLMRQVTTTIRSGLEATFADALMNVRSLEDGVKALGREIAQIFARRAAAQVTSGLFGLAGFAEGGHVRGPGTEKSDSIPALLSNNEFVMPASAVRSYGVGFMEAIRKMQVPRSSFSAPSTAPRVARYAEGGLVSSAATAATSQQQPSYPVSVVVKNEGTAKSATAQTDFDGKSLVVSVLLNDIRNNGPVFRSMSSAQKSRR